VPRLTTGALDFLRHEQNEDREKQIAHVNAGHTVCGRLAALRTVMPRCADAAGRRILSRPILFDEFAAKHPRHAIKQLPHRQVVGNKQHPSAALLR
jgi:hypothetical protein